MTSPTTSADAVRTLGLFVAEYKVKCCRNKGEDCEVCRAADDAIALLIAQHAEAGAVADAGGLMTADGSLTYAGQRKVVEHMTVEIREAIALLHSSQSRAEAIDCQPIPAQPASQQGEDKDLKAVLERALKENAESGAIPSVLMECTKIRLARERVAILRALHRREECASGCPPQTVCDTCQYKGTHPTGDRVRVTDEMVERYCQSAWGDLGWPADFTPDAVASNRTMVRKNLTAALDQEKGR